MPSAKKTRPKALDDWGMVSTLPPPSVSTHGLTEVAPKSPLRAVASHPHRKVLILEDEPSIRNVLCVLLSGVGCEGDVALTDRQALELVSRESFDAVLLDLRSCSYSPEKLVTDMERIRPSLVGRVLVITGEVADPQTLDLVERLCLPNVPRSRLVHEIWSQLRRGFRGARGFSPPSQFPPITHRCFGKKNPQGSSLRRPEGSS